MLKRILNFREMEYLSSLGLENLKQKIEGLSEQKILSFSGRLHHKNQFTVYDKQNIIGWNNPGVKRKAAYIKGELRQTENGTIVHLVTKPNSFLPVFAIVAVLVGVVLTVIATSTMNNDVFLLLIGIVFLALGTIYYPLSTYFRNKLRNKVIKFLDLKKA